MWYRTWNNSSVISDKIHYFANAWGKKMMKQKSLTSVPKSTWYILENALMAFHGLEPGFVLLVLFPHLSSNVEQRVDRLSEDLGP